MKPKKASIIIVGAGMAGMAAGSTLTKDGFEVKILEARHRYGGRIHVDRSLGVPIGRGASWMHGDGNNPIKKLAQKYATKLHMEDFKKLCTIDRYGKIISPEQIEAFNQRVQAAIDRSKELALQQEFDLPLAQILDSLMSVDNFSILEQDLYRRKLKFFENYMGAEYEQLSARYWDEEDHISGHAFVADAYEAIIAGMASECSIQLDTVVLSITENKNGIEVLTNQGKYHADAVIVTLPLGVLKKQSVAFYPALSKEKQGAIHRLGMGLFNIVGMRFPNVFWPECPEFFLSGSQSCSLFVNLNHFINEPILLGYAGGKTARMLEAHEDSYIVQETINALQEVFGNKVIPPEQFFVTRWLSDPWSLGSYSYIAVGATEEDRDLLAAPESDRLCFAGEATYKKYSGTVHGAYLSGLREAERLKKIFN